MTRDEYLRRARDLYDAERISGDTYDEMIMNADYFCSDEDEYDSFLPSTYAEIEYDDLDTPEALAGCHFDDMNYLRYRER